MSSGYDRQAVRTSFLQFLAAVAARVADRPTGGSGCGGCRVGVLEEANRGRRDFAHIERSPCQYARGGLQASARFVAGDQRAVVGDRRPIKSARSLVSHGEDGQDGDRRKHPGLLRDHVDLAGLSVVWGRYVGGAYSQLLDLLAEVRAFPTS